jgi:hypothetical protein
MPVRTPVHQYTSTYTRTRAVCLSGLGQYTRTRSVCLSGRCDAGRVLSGRTVMQGESGQYACQDASTPGHQYTSTPGHGQYACQYASTPVHQYTSTPGHGQYTCPDGVAPLLRAACSALAMIRNSRSLRNACSFVMQTLAGLSGRWCAAAQVSVLLLREAGACQYTRTPVHKGTRTRAVCLSGQCAAAQGSVLLLREAGSRRSGSDCDDPRFTETVTRAS